MIKLKSYLFIAFCFFVVFPLHAQDGGIEGLRQTSKAFVSVASEVSPSVVFIQAEGTSLSNSRGQLPTPFGERWPFGDDLLRRFFGDQFPNTPRREAP